MLWTAPPPVGVPWMWVPIRPQTAKERPLLAGHPV